MAKELDDPHLQHNDWTYSQGEWGELWQSRLRLQVLPTFYPKTSSLLTFRMQSACLQIEKRSLRYRRLATAVTRANVYRAVVTICTSSLTFTNSTFCPHSVFMCFAWISEQTAIIFLYSINWLVFIPERECVYCAVRTGYLCIIFCVWPSETQWSLYVPPV